MENEETEENLWWCLKQKKFEYRAAALRCKNVTTDMLKYALNYPCRFTRVLAIEHPNLTREMALDAIEMNCWWTTDDAIKQIVNRFPDATICLQGHRKSLIDTPTRMETFKSLMGLWGRWRT